MKKGMERGERNIEEDRMSFLIWTERVRFLMLGLLFVAVAVFQPATVAADDTPPKLRVAVLQFDNKVPNAQAEVGVGMADMLIRELDKIGRFEVVERESLAEILGEQDFTNSGRVQRGQQLSIGRIKGAHLLIKGAVTEFSYNVQNRNVGLGYRGFGIGFTEGKARVAIDMRLIDPVTGEIIQTYDEAVEVSATGANVAGTLSGFSFSGGGSNNHPMGQAVRQLIDKSINVIMTRLDTSTVTALMAEKFQGSVVKADGPDRIVINRGSSDGVSVGDKLTVRRVIEELIDPETGELLGREEITIGEIQVTQVNDRWSEGRALWGEGFQRGDVVVK